MGMGIFLFKRNDKLKTTVERKTATENSAGGGASIHSSDKINVTGFQLSHPLAPRGTEERHEGTDVMERATHVPVLDIMALYSHFRSSLQECTNFAHKKAFVSRVKSFSSQVVLSDGGEGSVDPESLGLAVVKYVSMKALRTRLRLAVALQNFCRVTEWEIENEEIEGGTGLLAALRGNFPNLGRATNDEGAGQTLKSFSPLESFDPARIYHQVLTTDTLPTMQEMIELFRRTHDVLRQEANVVLISTPCVVVGDIHGQKRDLVEKVLVAGGPIGPVNDKEDSQQGGSGDKTETDGGRNYLFLGDIVDRGPDSLGCLTLLFAAKLIAPERVCLLRGNHESSETNRNYGFLKECWERYPHPNGVEDDGSADCGTSDLTSCMWDLRPHLLWTLANEVFRSLPLCAVVTRSFSGDPKEGMHNTGSVSEDHIVCAMHGGLSPFIAESLDGILAVNRFRDIVDGPLADMTWADPVPGLSLLPKGSETLATAGTDSDGRAEVPCDTGASSPRREGMFVHHHAPFKYNEPVPTADTTVGYVHSARGRGYDFGEDVTLRFLRKNKLGFIIRAHQCVMEGYEWQHQKRLLTIFSAPNYCGLGNKGAILILHKDGAPEVVQFEADNTVNCGVDMAECTKPSPVPPREFCS
uniref:Serine/threonine-protein phosphatase n=1 Tax=Trypanosoma congolense (strain IL3000) TaxID=1068625 RepID=G0UWM9_TRYCI|nr:putative serine/threonine protein phosphatase [Trypanosoma congolense IL3000]